MTTWAEPKAGGVPFTEETLEPEHVNSMVANERVTWGLAALRRRVARSAALYDVAGKIEAYWSPTHEHLLCVNSTQYRQYSADGELVREEASYLESPTVACAYEVAGSNRVEVFSTTALGTSAAYTANGGDSWATLTTPTFRATGRPLWTGGTNSARVVPGRYDATSTHGCLLYLAGATAATITRHNLTVDGDIQRIATNGTGRVVFATPGYVFTNTDYGATLGAFSYVTMPTLASGDTTATARVGMAYDATRALFVMARAQTNGTLAFNTSTDGATWSGWRSVGAVDASSFPLPDIAIVDKVWFLSGNDFNYDGHCSRYWASFDGGATWLDLGRGALGSGVATELTYQTNDLLACGNSIVGLRITAAAEGAAFDLFGPIDSYAQNASVAL